MPNVTCRLCGTLLSGSGLSFRQMPVCNRFTTTPEYAERHDLSLRQCVQCGLIQLDTALPVDAVRPRLPWIKYREPEAHLDAFCDVLLAEHGAKAATSFGVGPFDQPLLDRLAQRGVRSAALDIRPAPTASERGYPYLETWQLGLRDEHLAAVAGIHGTADIVCCRYLLEHCHDPAGALRGMRHLLSAGGVLIVEVPDSSKFLAACDYSFIWEEHVSYFVEATLRRLATTAGYDVAVLHRGPGELEDALTAVLRPTPSDAGERVAEPCVSKPGLFSNYVANLAPSRECVQAWATTAAGPSGDGLALFGIGHQALMFAHAMGLSGRIAAAVDDDPDKCGYFPPGFQVPIVPSQVLIEDSRTRACLFAVAPRIEQKIRDRLAPLKARGVEFRSIFAGVPGSLLPGSPP